MHKEFLKEYEKYKDKIYNHFYYRVSFNVEVSEDLTSETFFKAYKNFKKYDKKFAFSTWIYSIASNVLIDYFRKSGRDVNFSEEFEFSDKNDFVEEKMEEIDDNIDFEIIKKEIDLLPESQKSCIIYKFIDGLEYNEISFLVDKKQDTVRQIISRALKKIKKNINKK